MRLRVHNAEVFANYQKAVNDYPKNVCCSCQQLHQKKNITVIRFDDNLGTAVWPLLKYCLLEQDASAADDMHFMCNYCKPLIKRDEMPARCVLNGLHVVEVPPEFSRLGSLSKQFIQLAKAYQMVVQLGSYTAKVTTYNSLKPCKGTMLFLPLPLGKTLHTLEEVGENTTLASKSRIVHYC